LQIADYLIPALFLVLSLGALHKRVDLYDALVEGAGQGLGLLAKIVPSLVILLSAMGMLRASGAPERLTVLLSPALTFLGIPPETAPLMLLRPISGSGALAVGSELMSTYGPDSTIGRTAAVMLGSTETTFYTIAVYFGAAGIRHSRYTVFAALCADLAGFITAAFFVRLFFGNGA